MRLFDIKFQINLPFSYFNHLGCIHRKLSEFKVAELEHYFCGDSLIDFGMSHSINEYHCGFECTAGLFGYIIHFQIYDIRHCE